MDKERGCGPTTSCRLGVAIVAALLAMQSATGVAQTDDDVSLRRARGAAVRAAAERVAPSVVRIETIGGLERVGSVLFGSGTSTGLIVHPDGYILSSAFAFRTRPASVLVQLADGERLPASIVATDHSRMLTLLKVDADHPLPVPRYAPAESRRVGQTTIAMGRTFTPDRPNVAVGILSATSRIWGKAIQTDAAASPANYGGPLIDLQGRVLGLLVPLSPGGDDELAGYEWYDSGIAFAIPAEQMQRSLERMREQGDLTPGHLGVNLRGKSVILAEPVAAEIHPGSPAAEAGLAEGDRIVEIDGQPIRRGADMKRALTQRYAGDEVRIVVTRGEERLELSATLIDELQPYQHPFLGILPVRQSERNEAEDDSNDLPESVTIRWVYPDSPAAEAKLEPGDVLQRLGGDALTDRRQAVAVIAERRPGQEVSVDFMRGGEPRTARLKLATLPESVPAGPLPPPAEDAKDPNEADYAETDTSVDGFDNIIHTYVPGEAVAGAPHGLLLWLHSSDASDWTALRDRWAPLCRRHRLVLVAPEAGGDRWHRREAELIGKILNRFIEQYSIDPARVVLAGRESGGAMAMMVGSEEDGPVSGIASIGAPFGATFPENRPELRRAYLLAHAENSPYAPAVKSTIERLRKARYPTTVWPLGEEPRGLNKQETESLARWIDTLDRL